MTTGFMNGVIVKNIVPGSNDPDITPIGVVLHVAVSESDSLYDYFAHRSGGIESHFYVRNDGTIEQYRSVVVEADAQSIGNSFFSNSKRYGFISIETEGMGAGKWSNAQIESLKKIMNYVHSIHPFPWRETPRWNEGGIGYHSLFREWNPDGHSCPGPDRIKQFNDVIIPWVKSQGHGTELPVVHLSSFRLFKITNDAKLVKKALEAHGFGKASNGGFWGPGVKRSYKRWQQHLGYSGKDADGVPGISSLKSLGFRAV